MNLVALVDKCGGQVLELAGKILVEKKYLQLLLARPQAMRRNKPSRLTHPCHSAAKKCNSTKVMKIDASHSWEADIQDFNTGSGSNNFGNTIPKNFTG